MSNIHYMCIDSRAPKRTLKIEVPYINMISHWLQHFSWHVITCRPSMCSHKRSLLYSIIEHELILSMPVMGPEYSGKVSVLTPYATQSLEIALEDPHQACHFVAIWRSFLTLKGHMFCNFHCHVKRSNNSFTLVSKYSYSPLINT